VPRKSGRYEDARRHLLECRDLADRFGYDWLAPWSRTQLATLAVASGQLEEARALLDEGLRLSLGIHSTSVSLVLVGFARLVLAVGDPERAARLAAVAEDLRERAHWAPSMADVAARRERAESSNTRGAGA
jgi:Tetratricopeptide repeat